MFTLRSFIRAAGIALTAGAALGFLAPTFETTGGSAGHVAHLVLSAGWSWCALAFCVGLARQSKIESALLAPASLMVAVIAYYATKLERSTFLATNLSDPAQGVQVDAADYVSKIVGWCVAAAFLGCILGLAGNLARLRGLRGLPLRLLIPVSAAVEMTERLRVEASSQEAVVGATWSAVRLVAVAALVVLVGRAVTDSLHRRSGRRRENSA
ncbi:DUF6518 family protein [Streptomyces cadmiisoli]|uniref:DUF6518 family protein n=1 Tax=Streptomyces cadmiisoli TaxID=2184053 RepID=UPI003D751084